MDRPPPPTVRISFEGPYDAVAPHVIVYNPEVLSFACLTQVNRFGLIGDRKVQIAGKLKGKRKSLTEMIQSYGNNIEIVRLPKAV
jgi:hypothetical protein